MIPPSLLLVLILPVLLIASAFFSGSETALFSLTRYQRARLKRTTGINAAAINTLLSETRGLLITLLLGNMTVNVLYFVVSSAIMIDLSHGGKAGPVITTLLSLLTLLALILLGEVSPKLIASRLTMPWANVTAVPLLLVHRLIGPVRLAAAWLVITPLARLLSPARRPADLSADELESLLELSRSQGVIDSKEQQMLGQVLMLNRLKVRDLMVPRVDIEAHDVNGPPGELVELIRRTRLRHVPVYEDSLDRITGIITALDAMLHRPATVQQLRELIQPAQFVPEQQRADALLVYLRKTGTTIAIVVDEYGGTAGLVGLEDVVEHMVGDIPGSYERTGQTVVEQLGAGMWRVGADLSVHEWIDVFGHRPTLRSSAAAPTTLGGVVMALLGHVPTVGDSVDIGRLNVTVETMTDHRIDTLTIHLTGDGKKEDGQ